MKNELKKSIVERIKNQPGSYIKFGVTDIDGVLRSKLISKEKFLKAVDEGIGFCNVIFGWDINDVCYDNSVVSGWHTGYPDSQATLDLNTIREIPWENSGLFFIADFEHSEELSEVCPRNILKRIIKQLNDLGYTPKIGYEFEWFNFRETPQSWKEKNYSNPTPLTPGMFGYSSIRAGQHHEYMNDLFELLTACNIPLEGLHTETGDGVYEACIKYGEALKSADRANLFKTFVKQIAYNHEIMPSFMAKWDNDLPGCSGHIHQSVWNIDSGENVFYDTEDSLSMSQVMKSYLAGQLHCLSYILPLFAPSVNSYRRFVEGSWAPTSVGWGVENRTTAFRVVNSSKESLRIENRVPGADANPYLAIAASIASGLYGIKNELELEIELTKGNEYQTSKPRILETDLEKATLTMKESEIPSLLFGEAFVDHFIRTREWEWQQFDPDQDNWEHKRYFEII